MSYVALHFDVSAADGDTWSDALLQAGALSVDATDPRAGTLDESPVFDERVDGERRWWPISRLTALVAADTDAEALLKRASRIAARSIPIFETTRIADQDWVRATQAQFQPIRITDDLWIVPTWCTAPVADAINIALDPGVAFGTGAHPTTRLCLAWLRSVVSRGSSVLDYGCGSGILAIAAAKLGAHPVMGVDIDPQAVTSSIANGRLNDVDATFADVDALNASARFDKVVANILANPLRMLAPALAAHTVDGGSIALAGILVAQVDDVATAFAPWFDMSIWRTDDDWALLSGVRRREAAREDPQ